MARQGKRGRLPGIVDVANRAKVSPATVSRYFNDPDIVRYRTRERIRHAVEELGYVRNRAMRSMIGGATGSIGLVIPTIDNAIFSEMLQTFSSALATHGRTMLIAAHGYDLAREAVLVHSLSEQRVDALALIGLDHRPETLAQIGHQGIPAAMLWNYRPGGDWPCIASTTNWPAGCRRHLLALGQRNICSRTGEERSTNCAAGRRKARWTRRGGRLWSEPRPHARPYISPVERNDCPGKLGQAGAVGHPGRQRRDRPGAMFAAASLGVACGTILPIIGIGDFRARKPRPG